MRRLKKVYSIFICMNPPNYRKNTINQYSIQEEFNIKMTQELEREVSEMCNLSEGIEERAAEKTLRETNKNINEENTINNMFFMSIDSFFNLS